MFLSVGNGFLFILLELWTAERIFIALLLMSCILQSQTKRLLMFHS